MILLAISAKLWFILIGSGILLVIIIVSTILHLRQRTGVYGEITKIEPPVGDDDYTNIVLWSQGGGNTYRVYISKLGKVKVGTYVGLHKSNFESIYSIDFIEGENIWTIR